MHPLFEGFKGVYTESMQFSEKNIDFQATRQLWRGVDVIPGAENSILCARSS